MGYYTNFTLDILENPENTDEEFILFKLGKISVYESWDGNELSNAKWYNYDKDMLTLSNEFPNVAFKLSGNGDETGDQWVSYYKAGKSVKHIMPEWTPPVFNEADLI